MTQASCCLISVISESVNLSWFIVTPVDSRCDPPVDLNAQPSSGCSEPGLFAAKNGSMGLALCLCDLNRGQLSIGNIADFKTGRPQ
jgi:hypothetical protein